MTELTLADASLADGRRVDVGIADGAIASVEPVGGARRYGERIELGGALVGPALVEGHIHLDKTLLGAEWHPHRVGASISERIAAEKKLLREVEVPLLTRAIELARQIAAFGTGYVRSHVDIDPEIGLEGLHALLEVRERCADLIELQIVAFPQSGVLAAPGTSDLLGAALSEGADLIGGLDPATIDGDVAGQLDLVFGLAERHGKGVDIHLHDPGALGTFELRCIAERAEALGMGGNVAVSHAYALGMVGADDFAATAEALSRGGVAIMTNGPGAMAMPPVKALQDVGVRVFAGSDNIRDAWWPYGNGDMLERTMMIGYRQGMYTDEDLAVAYGLATSGGAAVLGVPDYGVKPGAPANLVAYSALAVPEAVVVHGPRRLVLRDGRVIARDGQLI